MKILIVNTFDTFGGAARASYRLHKSLNDSGVESIMLVQNKLGDDYTVLSLKTSFLGKLINKLRPLIDSIPTRFYKDKSSMLFSSAWFGNKGVISQINEINPDIVHLNWVCGGMIKIEDICKIRAPIVWTLHDNWGFTGGCHIMWDCTKYQTNCGSCPRLGSNYEKDLSRTVFNRKQKTFSKLPDLVVVSLSRWLYDCAKNSALFVNNKIVNIPNPIDTTIFKPLQKEKARELWNLPHNKKLILFGAISGTSDVNKGFIQLKQALDLLEDDDTIEFVIFGSSAPKENQYFKMKTHYLGHLSDDVSLVSLYSAVDVMIVPSLQEAFGQTASESMACGTPVVAFGHTGLLDIIDHKINGYLAKPFDINDLAFGIKWILANSISLDLAVKCRSKIVKEFDNSVVVEKFIKLYREIIFNNI